MKRTYASGGEEEALMDSLRLEEGAVGGRVFPRALSRTPVKFLVEVEIRLCCLQETLDASN